MMTLIFGEGLFNKITNFSKLKIFSKTVPEIELGMLISTFRKIENKPSTNSQLLSVSVILN